MDIHLQANDAYDGHPTCGRTSRSIYTTKDQSRVTCLFCKEGVTEADKAVYLVGVRYEENTDTPPVEVAEKALAKIGCKYDDTVDEGVFTAYLSIKVEMEIEETRSFTRRVMVDNDILIIEGEMP